MNSIIPNERRLALELLYCDVLEVMTSGKGVSIFLHPCSELGFKP